MTKVEYRKIIWGLLKDYREDEITSLEEIYKAAKPALDNFYNYGLREFEVITREKRLNILDNICQVLKTLYRDDKITSLEELLNKIMAIPTLEKGNPYVGMSTRG
ncbi:hypothetical protein ES695_14430 [Candidatus Atribacteria bacterium 1244-E10-H5-B2]|nr:MAG: hypothetical protein ES695_14430 [Candidatus Atribacteria bacterium 1244-E10-H5-B2]